MKRSSFLIVSLTIVFTCFGQPFEPVNATYPKLEQLVKNSQRDQANTLGYPCNQFSELESFYHWYLESGLSSINLNNAGNPFDSDYTTLNTHMFEREVIEFFAPFYGFEKNNIWGIVTNSGTDGNNHGIYFGTNILLQQTGKLPVVYVSDEAHYSNKRLCDLQNLEVRLIKTDKYGCMLPDDLEKQLDPKRGCLIIYAMGSTLKGAIDDIPALNAVLDRYPQMPVYRHVDAALFGGYLPFTSYRDMLNQHLLNYQSISISGHKFFGIDSPSGLFITSKNVYNGQTNFTVSYLNNNMRMISCSRDAIQPLKFWWLIQQVGEEKWTEQAKAIMINTEYLKKQLDQINWPNWSNKFSNTVLLQRPNDEIVKKYNLACGEDQSLGGPVAHIVVMQHVTPEVIDRFIADLQDSL